MTEEPEVQSVDADEAEEYLKSSCLPMMLGLGLLVGTPIAAAIKFGWFSAVPGFVVGAVLCFIIFDKFVPDAPPKTDHSLTESDAPQRDVGPTSPEPSASNGTDRTGQSESPEKRPATTPAIPRPAPKPTRSQRKQIEKASTALAEADQALRDAEKWGPALGEFGRLVLHPTLVRDRGPIPGTVKLGPATQVEIVVDGEVTQKLDPGKSRSTLTRIALGTAIAGPAGAAAGALSKKQTKAPELVTTDLREWILTVRHLGQSAKETSWEPGEITDFANLVASVLASQGSTDLEQQATRRLKELEQSRAKAEAHLESLERPFRGDSDE